jgi:hypothetical protein
MTKIALVLSSLLFVFFASGTEKRGNGYPFELYRVSAATGDAEFLLYTVRFPQSKDDVPCQRFSPDHWICDEQIKQLDRLRHELEKIRELLRLHLGLVKVVVTAEGYASIERENPLFSNLWLADQRATWVYDQLKSAVPLKPPFIENFQIKPVAKGVYIRQEWRDDLNAVAPNQRFWNERQLDMIDEVIAADHNRCRNGFGLVLEPEYLGIQDALRKRVEGRQTQQAHKDEWEEGRRVEIWLRTNSPTIRKLINPARRPPCTERG